MYSDVTVSKIVIVFSSMFDLKLYLPIRNIVYNVNISIIVHIIFKYVINSIGIYLHIYLEKATEMVFIIKR